MGLDAFVRCRCFEEGKLKPGPIPLEDLYIDDEDGCVPKSGVSKHFRCLKEVRLFPKI